MLSRRTFLLVKGDSHVGAPKKEKKGHLVLIWPSQAESLRGWKSSKVLSSSRTFFE
jgi:hypothetical protein